MLGVAHGSSQPVHTFVAVPVGRRHEDPWGGNRYMCDATKEDNVSRTAKNLKDCAYAEKKQKKTMPLQALFLSTCVEWWKKKALTGRSKRELRCSLQI